MSPDPECDAIEWVRARLAKRREQLEEGARGRSSEEVGAEVAALERTLGELTFARFAASHR